jgi:hypothetical protein
MLIYPPSVLLEEIVADTKKGSERVMKMLRERNAVQRLTGCK